MSNPDDYSNHYALLIGTGTDLDGGYSARFQSTINDAKWLAIILKECGFPDKNVKVLTKYNATKENIISELGKIKKSIAASKKVSNKASKKFGTIVVFFSGFCRMNDDNEAFLIPYSYSKPYNFTDYGINGESLVDQINLLYADKVLIVLNTYSDTAIPRLGPLSQDYLELLSDSNGGFAALSATQASENAQTAHSAKGASDRYSPFTIAFGRALSGVGKTKPEHTNLIRTDEVFNESTAIVEKLTKGKQQLADYHGFFPVGRYWEPKGKEIPFLGDDDEITVDIEGPKEQAENLATPTTSTTSTTPATPATPATPSNITVHYHAEVNARQSQTAPVNNYGSGTISNNWTTKD